MKRWPTKPLGEIAHVTAGDPAPQRAEDFSADGVPFVRMQDVGRFGQTTCLVETKDRLSESTSPKFKRFPAGSILVPKSGASIRLNHRAILGTEAHVVSHLAVILPKPSLNTRFAYYWLCGTDLSRVAHQTDLPSMKTSDLAKLPFPVPPLAEQERIVKLLDEADELRKLRAQADRRTAALIPALFHEMFGDPATNQKGWKVQPLGGIVSVRHGFAFKSEHFSNAGKFVLLTPGNFYEEGGYRHRGAKQKYYVGPVPPSYILNANDLLLAMTEQAPGLLGSPILIPESNSFLHNQRLGLIEMKTDLEKLFLFHFFNTPVVRNQIQATSTGLKVKHTSPAKIMAINIPIPPLALQTEFAQRVTEIRALETAQATSRTRLDALFQSIFHRAVNAEI